MSGKQSVATVITALAAITIVGCTSSTTSNPGSQTSTPIVSSSAIAKAKQQATACFDKTGLSGLLSSSGRTELVNCLQSIVPPDKQEAFKNCVTSAATSDKIWTSEGWTKFTDTSLPNCLNQVA